MALSLNTLSRGLTIGLIASLGSACMDNQLKPATADLLQTRSAGDTTVFSTRQNAFSLPSANLSVSKRGDFQAGNSFFREPWVIAPSSTDLRDGLGPLFNVSSCQACHIRDGRGHAPQNAQDSADSLLVRLAIPPQTQGQQAQIEQGFIANAPEPHYGAQLQDRAIPGVDAEAQVHIQWTTQQVKLADGSSIELRRPQINLQSLAYGELHPDAALSARIAPPMIGLGLIDAIDEADIVVQADPQDADGDGISGRANRVFDPISGQTGALGRYGWKALTPSVAAQVVAAFNGDIGITSHAFSQHSCTAAQSDCLASPDGGQPELSSEVEQLVVFYSHHLAVPARRDVDDPQVIAGARVFADSGCAQCHTPRYVTGQHPDQPELSGQTIFPFTDVLLHDMGPDLADDVSEFQASGSEWRTPPLWGLGLTQTVAGDQAIGFLHDGRARTPLEAILWHGGEAAAARDAVINLSSQQRLALLRFLDSL